MPSEADYIRVLSEVGQRAGAPLRSPDTGEEFELPVFDDGTPEGVPVRMGKHLIDDFVMEAVSKALAFAGKRKLAERVAQAVCLKQARRPAVGEEGP